LTSVCQFSLHIDKYKNRFATANLNRNRPLDFGGLKLALLKCFPEWCLAGRGGCVVQLPQSGIRGVDTVFELEREGSRDKNKGSIPRVFI